MKWRRSVTATSTRPMGAVHFSPPRSTSFWTDISNLYRRRVAPAQKAAQLDPQWTSWARAISDKSVYHDQLAALARGVTTADGTAHLTGSNVARWDSVEAQLDALEPVESGECARARAAAGAYKPGLAAFKPGGEDWCDLFFNVTKRKENPGIQFDSLVEAARLCAGLEFLRGR